MECRISKEEVKRAVWDCGVDKSPGPDGFSFSFYRHFWPVIEKDVFEAVDYFFMYGEIPNGLRLWVLNVEDGRWFKNAGLHNLGGLVLRTPFTYLGTKVGGKICQAKQAWKRSGGLVCLLGLITSRLTVVRRARDCGPRVEHRGVVSGFVTNWCFGRPAWEDRTNILEERAAEARDQDCWELIEGRIVTFGRLESDGGLSQWLQFEKEELMGIGFRDISLPT
ncbi:hypothetical protein Tco_1001331 [Tanacetum coccineum]